MMKDVGNAKVLLSKQLKNSENILTMLLGKDYEDKYEDVEEEIGKHIFDCLFIEGAEHILTEKGTYIFYDIDCPIIHANVKNIRITLDILCERGMLRNFSDLPKEIVKEYSGNRVDKLASMIDEVLIGDKKIALKPGIGALTLEAVRVYNLPRYYGKSFIFTVPNFR